MAKSSQVRAPLERQHFQVLVIGGGINGVAIARECARAHRSVLLVEQNDFASGTTSRSTRIIHGGLRYLEHAELGLVRESLRERQRLLRDHPQLVQPMQFLLALDDHGRHNALAVRAGLWLYSALGSRHSNAADVQLQRRKLERLLDQGRHWSMFDYEDAQCEFPERLVAEWLSDALASGAAARNHTEVLAVDVSNGRARGALLRDRITGQEDRVEAIWIINATGPWADRLCQRSRISTHRPMLGGVRGSHLVLPRFSGAPDAAVYAEALDGRPIFVIPWNGQVLLGTTEVSDQGDPGRSVPSAEEIDYLLRSFARIFPRSGISASDLRYAFAGVRPLPASSSKNPGSISRRHVLHDHTADGAAQMISVLGGKLTTAAELARQCARAIGIPARNYAGPVIAHAESMDPLLDQWVLRIAEGGSISEHSARGIVEWFGARSSIVAQMALSSAHMRASLCPHTNHIVAEAVYAFNSESAVTLADVLLRRVPVALGPCWSGRCSRDAALRIAIVMGWNDAETAAHLESMELERSEFLRKPLRTDPVEAAAD